jgi:phospholipid/cholesterol/gamma-HCH transport system substrate-binding protein
MNNRFKFRYVNEITGAFVLFGLLFFIVAGILTIGSKKKWFRHDHHILVQLPEEGTYGLQKGSDIQIMGTKAGSVEELLITDNGSMQAKVSIRRDFFQFVRQDSEAIIRKKINLSFDSYIEIKRGQGDLLLNRKGIITCSVEEDIKTVIEGTFSHLRMETLPALVDGMQGTRDSLEQVLNHIIQIAEMIKGGEGIITKLLTDRSLAEGVEKTQNRFNTVLEEMRAMLMEAQKTSIKINKAMELFSDLIKGLEKEMDSASALVHQSMVTIQQIEKLVLGMQKHWLIRKYIEEQELPGRISPSEIIIE